MGGVACSDVGISQTYDKQVESVFAESCYGPHTISLQHGVRGLSEFRRPQCMYGRFLSAVLYNSLHFAVWSN